MRWWVVIVACLVEAADPREQIRRTLFMPEPLPALDARVHGRFEAARGVSAERISYATQFGMRVPAILYLPSPAPAGKIPALIVVNGHGGDKYSWYAFYSGVLYARAGAAVLTYDPAGEGERNAGKKSGTRAHDEVFEELGPRVGGLMVTDVMQAVSYLSSRPEIDPGRIGAMGYSMGSFILGIAGAADQRLRACVLTGGGNLDGPGEYWDRSKPMCQGNPYRSLMFLGDRPAVLFSLHQATLAFNGDEDTVVAIPTHGRAFFDDLQTRVKKLRSDTDFEFGFLSGASHRPWFVTRAVARWFERRLDFPKWSTADIEAMPETHIGVWAREQNVAMDPLYATEHREGGTRALGSEVPGLARATLSVYSDEEWLREKERLIHSSWVREAKRRAH
jgi:dienelactone hydrolase